MACSPVGLFRLMDRKLSPVGTKVSRSSWNFFQVLFQPLRLFILLRRSCSLSYSWLFVPYRWTGFISFRSPFWLSRGLWFVDVIFVSLGKKITKIKKIQGSTNNCCQVKFDICSIHIFVSFFLLLFSSNLTIVYNSFPPRRKQPRTSINAFISFAGILNYDVVNSERWLSHHPGPPRMFYCVHRTSTRLWNAWLQLSGLVSKLSNHGLYFLNS